MNSIDSDSAVAKVICRILREKRPKDTEDGLKFYFLDIHPECVAKAIDLVVKDPVLGPITEIHLARNVFAPLGLPDALLTDDAVGDFRNEELQPGRRLMLLGPPDVAREWETIKFMHRIDGGVVMEGAAYWVAEFAPPVLDDQRSSWWCRALEGLNELHFAELDEYANFVLRTAAELANGLPLQEALGTSLPALRLPKHVSLFSINERLRGHRSQWQRKFNDHKRKTKCFLEKKDKSDVFLDKEALENALKLYEADPEHDRDLAPLLRDYVAADYGWTQVSDRIAEIDWPTFSAALIEPIAREKTRNLGSDTLKMFQEDNTLPDLTDEQQEYLQELTAARTKSEPGDDDRRFFKTFYRQLQTNPTIFSRWEGFIMEKSVEDEDFFAGLAKCIKTLRPRSATKPWRLVVTAKAAIKDLLQVYEPAAIAFATRYRGVHSVLASAVDFRSFDELMKYPELLPTWKKDPSKSKRLKGQRPSKASCQITFYVHASSEKDRKLKLVWRFNPKSVYASLRQDIDRLANASSCLVCTEVKRETSGRRAVPINLADTKSFQPVFGKIAGTLIPQADNLKPYLIPAKLDAVLNSLQLERHILPAQAQTLRDSFSQLESEYKQALIDFLSTGLAAKPQIQKAAAAYESTLQAASSNTLPDVVHAALLPLLLSISTVDVISYGPESQTTSLVPPWHPLRLLASVSKATQFGALVQQLCSSSHTLSDADGDLLFEDVREWLAHVYYPEIVCRLQRQQPKLLALCDSHGDYSVHEPPVREPGANAPTDSDPKAAAIQIAQIIKFYLSLQPHERDNLSVVLFDCDSELLPQAVVEQIRKMSESEEQDAMCQILLAHSDKKKLRALYRTLSRREENADTFSSSEATRDFMARLRINIMVAENGEEAPKGGQPYDIVFAENAVARCAQLKWEDIEVDAADPDKVKPSAWSRRRPMRSGPVTSAVYLTSPRAPAPLWTYVRAIGHAVEPDDARKIPEAKCLVPCRVLGMHDETIGSLINRMHTLGTWVVNYDELLHRKLLSRRDIKIIRYKQESTQGKNLIISSRAKVEMLRNELGRLALRILPELDKDALAQLTCDLINEANSISGNLVLRAIRRKENAKELFGLVLSKYLISAVLKGNRRLGWFLLDDYADWLGEDEKQIADIFCLSPAYSQDNTPVLDLVVTEAKFVDHELVHPKSKESASQLRQSLVRLESGLNPDNPSLDREIWLARISDMIVDGMEMSGDDKFDASEWRRKVRDGGCAISIRGFSHVFDDGPEVGNTEVVPTPLHETANGVQEIYSLAATRQLLSAFLRRESAPRPQDAPPETSRRLVVPAEEPVAGIFREPASPEPAPTPDTAHPVHNLHGPEEKNTLQPAPGLSAAHSAPNGKISPGTPPASIIEALGTQPINTIDADAIKQWAERTTITCRKALLSYGMHAELAGDPILTPNSLLLKFKGTDSLTEVALAKKSGELRTTHALDVIGIRGGLGEVTAVISRPEREKILLSQVWKRWNPTLTSTGNNSIVIAVKEDDNQLLHLSPVPLPHTLVAGMTGSGKSVLLQNLILGIAATNTPEQAQLAIIDPKRSAQLKHFEKLPHMLCSIVNDQQPSLDLLGSLCDHMDQRNKRLSEADASDIDEYIAAGHRDMSRIWVVYDEYGDWIRDSEEYKKQALALLDRLAMKARSSGIYLVLAAQRPDNSLFSMVLRSNLGNRLALLVADEGTSDVATGVKGLGAERLLGGGHLLAKTGNFKEPVYAQVPYVSPEEVRRAVRFIIERDSRQELQQQ